MDLLNLRVWCLSSRQLCGGEGGYSSFFVHICFDLLNPQPNNIAPVFVQRLTTIVQVSHQLFIGTDFQLDILWVFSRWTSGSRTHTFAPFPCTHLIYHCVHKKSRGFQKFSYAGIQPPALAVVFALFA